MKPTNEPTNKDLSDSKPANQIVPDFNYKKLPEIIDLTHKLDKPNQANPFQATGQKSDIPNVKPWPSVLNLDQNGYPIANWNDYYNAYFGALSSLNNPQNAMSGQNANQNSPNSNLNSNQNGNQNSNQNVNQNASPNQNNHPNGQTSLNSKDFNSLLWQMMDPNQAKNGPTGQTNLFDSLTSNIQQQQFLQSLFNKQFNNWLDNSNKNTAALSYLNYLNSKQQAAKQGKPEQPANPPNRPTIDQVKSNAFNSMANNLGNNVANGLADNPNNPANPSDHHNPINANSNPINKLDKGTSVASIGRASVDATSSTVASVPASNLNKARYVSYDFKQPFVQYNGRDDYYPDENEQDNNSAVIALVLGLFITILLIVIVGYRMRSIKKRIQRRGGRTLAHDADYLVNGMYL